MQYNKHFAPDCPSSVFIVRVFNCGKFASQLFSNQTIFAFSQVLR
jgi:hypothetical protein